jgi:hypothetical protein
MKRQFEHMMRYKYIPFSWGKKKYAGEISVNKEGDAALKKVVIEPNIAPAII